MAIEVPVLEREPVSIPSYLTSTYWWAYVHPRAVYLFERQWLVNVILWGNFGRLRDAALDALGKTVTGRTLQVACVYGDLTARLAARLAPGASLDVVDVLPIQLANLRRKLPAGHGVGLHRGDSTALAFKSGSYDRALLFFLLHEQPEEARRETIREALRVVKPGGEVVIVDYHRPAAWNPLYWPMRGILAMLEPFALDLWSRPLEAWFPEGAGPARVERRTLFGGLYQLLRITV